jgi:hypothetical protein
MKKLILAGLASLALCGSASATTLFTDDFEGYTLGTPSALTGTWTVDTGSIDVIGPANGYNWYGPGKYVDLNGTPDGAAQISTVQQFALVAGASYQLSFDYGVNKNSPNNEGLRYGVGGNYLDINIPAGGLVSLVSVVYNFVAVSTGSFSIFFKDLNLSTGDLGGPILDNVKFADSITRAVVPLPAGIPLLGGGLAILGFMGWRKKRSTAQTA